ncbi:hypothetical protein F4815DRAFT_500501 [Daldinia loculata]|nr:hypothetical protein F4815DRAFT_500501 [Daldinia loculata]
MNPVELAEFRQVQQERAQEDMIIAVMGRTGCGKSKFISRLNPKDCGSEFEHILDIKPSFILDVEHGIKGYRILMLDTPGHDDTVGEDVSALKHVEEWLRCSYPDKSLFGLIYMHDINEAPIGRSSVEFFKRLRNITGEENMSKVTLLTTKWDSIHDDQPGGDAREAHLHETSDFWKGMIADGATVMRHDDTVGSAKRVVQKIFNKQIAGAPFGREIIRLRQELNELVEAKRESDAAFEGRLSGLAERIKESQERLTRLEGQFEEYRAAKGRVATVVITIRRVLLWASRLWKRSV